MFDSEHFLRNHLDRVNNWEIHPVMKMEYCTTGASSTIGDDAGWKSIRDGIPLVLASDSGPGNFHSNPFVNILLAATYPSNPKEAITREQALIAFTRTAAYSVFAEEKLGTLEPGKVADLAVLSQDIFQVSNTELPKTESALTIVGGKIAYAQNGFQ